MSGLRISPLTTLLSAVLLTTAPLAAQDPPSEESIKFFKTNCSSCHTIGGGALSGPDLKDVSARQERAWLLDFMLDPQGVIDSGDPYALKLLANANGAVMPPLAGDRELAGKLLDLIDAESALETSRFAGVQLSDRPLTDDDVARGRALFTGQEQFEAGGPACISCHAVGGLDGLGGGRLGPDLTSAYSRLEGRKALGAWLSSPPSVVMQPLFSDRPMDSEEVLALVAYLQREAESGQVEAPTTALEFVLAGILMAALLMMLFDVLWRRRFRTVRRALIAQR